jgi:acyl carrier protein
MPEDPQAAIEREVRSFLKRTFFTYESIDIKPDDNLLEKGVVDSTGVLELVNFLRERYAIRMTDRELTHSNLGSISSITAYVMRKSGATGSELNTNQEGE